ncbi:hypothetical protein M407DRAFT_91764 [Tulasnella calospora MUT 4182]|uniref:Uncharacterized protein n=1 Tax=Tulasnella calospora MUT 4182 TaxID=1051891 RepID=A0A0C3QGK3_9AGAM|nr:hypothetical protein M407DRAFT_91764 [Tulasnella calospora MUT 4182]
MTRLPNGFDLLASFVRWTFDFRYTRIGTLAHAFGRYFYSSTQLLRAFVHDILVSFLFRIFVTTALFLFETNSLRLKHCTTISLFFPSLSRILSCSYRSVLAAPPSPSCFLVLTVCAISM